MMIYVTDPRAKLPVLDGQLESMLIHCTNDCFECYERLGDTTSNRIKFVRVVAENGGLAWRCNVAATPGHSPAA